MATVPIAAEQHRRNCAEERGHQARSKAPSWFEVPVNSECTALTRAAHRVRRPDLDERGPDDHADHVRRAENGEGDEREREAGGEAEHDRGRPEDHDGTKEGGPDFAAAADSGRGRSTSPAPRRPGPSAGVRARAAPRRECRARKTGRSAVAPPSSTANRSSDIVPSSTRLLQMKATPEKPLSSVRARPRVVPVGSG